MEYQTIEGYSVGFLKCVALVADVRKLGGDEVSGPVLSGGPFEGASDGNREGSGPGESYTMSISKVIEDCTGQDPDGEVTVTTLGDPDR